MGMYSVIIRTRYEIHV